MISISRRNLLGLGVAAVTLPALSGGGALAAEAAVIDAQVNAAITEMFKTVKDSEALYNQAKGVLIMPDVTKAGFIVGGTYGEGALRVGGRTEAYYSVGGAAVGLLAGAESTKQAIFFMTDSALDKFRTSENWKAGIDADITLIKVGAGIGADTLSAPPPVIAIVFGRSGLMADASLKGAKYSKIDR